MRPLDPRLLRLARSSRGFVVTIAVLGTLSAALLIGQAWLLACVISTVVAGGAATATSGGIVANVFGWQLSLASVLVVLLLLLGLRAALTGFIERAAVQAAVAVKQELRSATLTSLSRKLLDRSDNAPPTGEVTAVLTRGIDALNPYFSRYLPALATAATVPLLVGFSVLVRDWVSALVLVLTIPLIPLFMALVGWYTQARVDKQWEALSRLAGHFLDVVSGLATLKVFGRARAQAAAVASVGSRYREATMGTLRVAFLSALVLELLSTLSVAVVAVGIGLRLVNGDMTLQTGLFVLIVIPEAYLPLRQVGAQFHASAEGLAAIQQILGWIEPHGGLRPSVVQASIADPGDIEGSSADAGVVAARGGQLRAIVELDGVTVTYPGQDFPAVRDVSVVCRPGTVTVVVGASGAGKSTLVKLALGLLTPDLGRVLVTLSDPNPVNVNPATVNPATVNPVTVDLATVEIGQWWTKVAWVPQQPLLLPGTIAQNLMLGMSHNDPRGAPRRLAEALAAAGLGLHTECLAAGLDTVVGADGEGLSVGQRQRVALARALLRDADLVILDEPTAALDAGAEAEVVATLRALAHGSGAAQRSGGPPALLVVSHRPALLEVADQVLVLSAWRAVVANGGTATVESGAVETGGLETGVLETGAVETVAVETGVLETVAVETVAVETVAEKSVAMETAGPLDETPR